MFGIAVAQKLDGGRGVVKVYRIFCLIVVICNVWILTIPLHVEFLCYVAIFTLSCFISVFISISFDLSKEDINVVDNLIVLSLLDYQIQLKSKDILESFNCLYVSIFNRTNFKLN